MLRKQSACVAFVWLMSCALLAVSLSPLQAQQTRGGKNEARPRRAASSTTGTRTSSATPQATSGEQSRTGDTSTHAREQTVAPDDADLSITAHVTARELRFEKVPNPTVEFTGQPRRETVWDAQRENLPAQVRPGETYRNIGITLRITSVFADIDRIVSEALGEIPASDDSIEQKPSPSPSTSPPPTPPQMSAQPATTTPANSPNTTRTSPARRERKN